MDAHTDYNYAFTIHPSCGVDDLKSIDSCLQLCIEFAINDYLWNCVDAHTESNYAFMIHPSCGV